MNEQIKQFEKRCWDNQTNHLNAAKFAKMIANECAKIAETKMTGKATAREIREHFGLTGNDKQ